MPSGKFEFLAQALAPFQQLINKALKGLPFAFGNLENIRLLVKTMKTSQTLENSV